MAVAGSYVRLRGQVNFFNFSPFPDKTRARSAGDPAAGAKLAGLVARAGGAESVAVGFLAPPSWHMTCSFSVQVSGEVTSSLESGPAEDSPPSAGPNLNQRPFSKAAIAPAWHSSPDGRSLRAAPAVEAKAA